MNQEKTSVNWYAHGARYYDPQLARWHSTDPLSELYSSSSTYGYVRNNPMNFIDPNGMSEMSSQVHNQLDIEGGHNYYNWEFANKVAGMTGSQFGGASGGYGYSGNPESGIEVGTHFDWRTGETYTVYEDASGKRYYREMIGSYSYQGADYNARTQFLYRNHYLKDDKGSKLDVQFGPGKSDEDVINEIIEGGREKFIEYLKNPNYGPQFFVNMFMNWTPSEEFERHTILFGHEGMLFTINEARKLQSWGHEHIEGHENSQMRHLVSSFIFAEIHGGLTARMFGFGNEGIGLFFDIQNHFRDQPSNAFQWGDLWNNEVGIWNSFFR